MIRGRTEDGADKYITPAPRKRIQSQLQRYLHDSIANIQLGDRFPDAANFAAPLDCVSKTPIELLRSYKPLHQKRRTLMYTSLTGAKTGWALFHISNRPNWQISEINLDSAQVRRKLALLVILRDNVYAAGDVFYNCTKGAKYALHSTVQTTLAKAINFDIHHGDTWRSIYYT